MATCAEARPGQAVSDAHTQLHDQDDDERLCWICLGSESEGGHLIQPCHCPRYTHSCCLARWQLVSAGKNEETRCRFCDEVLPDWRPALTPEELQPKPSVMSVRYKGVTHRIQYTPGPDGLDSFLSTLQAIGIKVASASQVTFLCRSPDTGEEMALRGLKAFDAAAYCASITAAKRIARHNGRRRSSGAGSDGAGDLGVHAPHPESPTAGAGGAGAALRCDARDARMSEDGSGGAGAALQMSAGERVSASAPLPAVVEPTSQARARMVAHVHAEALNEIEAAGGPSDARRGSEGSGGGGSAAVQVEAAPALLARALAQQRAASAQAAPSAVAVPAADGAAGAVPALRRVFGGGRARQRRARAPVRLWRMVVSFVTKVLRGSQRRRRD